MTVSINVQVIVFATNGHDLVNVVARIMNKEEFKEKVKFAQVIDRNLSSNDKPRRGDVNRRNPVWQNGRKAVQSKNEFHIRDV